MVIHFFLRYNTHFGQRIYIIPDEDKMADADPTGNIAMEYLNEDYWHAYVTLESDEPLLFSYYYLIVNEDGLRIVDGEKDRKLDLRENFKKEALTIIDKWIDAGDTKNIYYTKAFNIYVATQKPRTNRNGDDFTFEFRVKAPGIKENQTIFLLGSTRPFQNWDQQRPILLEKRGDWFAVSLQLKKHHWPAAYKFGIYDFSEKKIIGFEEGENRLLRGWELQHEKAIIHDGYVDVPVSQVRGVGVNIPVFSLRSKKSFGVGDFMDLKRLVNWCRKVDIRLVQLLPVNDTSAHDDWQDSYPYAAISAFALHPLYLNLEKVAGKKYAELIKKLSKKQKQLNDLPQVDYEQVMQFKRAAMRELYDLQKSTWKKDKKFQHFFEDNKHWLIPYAAFCYLKEKYRTPYFHQWKKYASYKAGDIQRLVDQGQRHYHQVAIYYFEQFHLHLQLKEAVDYAHRYGVILKGDLPIGVYRYSCDAWMNPSLYNLQEQAGAPPDDFAVSGQNWGFPTYNWEEMRKNGYQWWKDRFRQLDKYFDAFRIDHILGFFRIWSIPMSAVDGIMGQFKPAVPVNKDEFVRNQIYFDRDRYCLPFITDTVLKKIFDSRSKLAKQTLLRKNEDGTYILKDEVNTQCKALAYTEENGLQELKEGLMKLISNVILFEEEDSGGSRFHFRIDMQKTLSFKYLDTYTQSQLKWLYNNYFYERQNYFWKVDAMQKFPTLIHSTRMLVCGEDLGMVPQCVPEVMHDLGVIGLNIQRMPHSPDVAFEELDKVAYLSIVQPSTHDMSTLREWWTENPAQTKRFYAEVLKGPGKAPAACSAEIVQKIIAQHLQSPSILSIFLLQDLLAMDEKLWPENPDEERINIPADPHQYWRYRMNINLEELIKKTKFNTQLQSMIAQSGRTNN